MSGTPEAPSAGTPGDPPPEGADRLEANPPAAIEFEPTLEAVRAARDFVRAALTTWDLEDLSDVATLLTSELVTNAVLHAGSVLRLAASYQPPELTVEVRDASTAPPALGRSGDAERTGGRGLVLVDSLADRWGVRNHAGGKAVWFVLTAR
jgi:anti-sigma regulatory factor (Ser/Thr protein kinase)